jgi:hypothetical protein
MPSGHCPGPREGNPDAFDLLAVSWPKTTAGSEILIPARRRLCLRNPGASLSLLQKEFGSFWFSGKALAFLPTGK